MEQKRKISDETSEIKTRIPLWLYPSTLEAADRAMTMNNCKSRSEFIENAVRFYVGYLSGKDAVEFLPAALVEALRATVQSSENRIARLLFKLAVEQDMMMNVLAAGLEINTDDLDELRGRCVYDVKRTSGMITFKDAVKYQRGEE